MSLEIRVCDYPTYKKDYIVLDGSVKETPVNQTCDAEGCCQKLLLEPQTATATIAVYEIITDNKKIQTFIAIYKYSNNQWEETKTSKHIVEP